MISIIYTASDKIHYVNRTIQVCGMITDITDYGVYPVTGCLLFYADSISWNTGDDEPFRSFRPDAFSVRGWPVSQGVPPRMRSPPVKISPRPDTIQYGFSDSAHRRPDHFGGGGGERSEGMSDAAKYVFDSMYQTSPGSHTVDSREEKEPPCGSLLNIANSILMAKQSLKASSGRGVELSASECFLQAIANALIAIAQGLVSVDASTGAMSENLEGIAEKLGVLLYTPDDEDIEEEVSRPTIVCLCGSTRFSPAYQEVNFNETLAGKIVLTIGCDFKSAAGLRLTLEDKARLDELHLRKIDLADEVLILNVGGYIGDSTKNEISYARMKGKQLRFLEEDAT
jgi:hypothetical protein